MRVNTAPHPIVIAHRGASGYRPEHTRAAYELACALGADAIEPDIVASKDGVLVLRHENEISGTTDVARHPEFASRRTTKVIDGVKHTGWFTEDFTWPELATLGAVERLPEIRQAGSTFDSTEGILRLIDLMEILDEQSRSRGRQIVMVAEFKHAHYFESIGLPLDALFAETVHGWATDDNLIVESFEQTVVAKLRARGVPGLSVFLLEKAGTPPDLAAEHGRQALTYADHLTTEGLAKLATAVDGISVDRSMLLRRDAAGHTVGVTDLVDRAHAAGLLVFTWTLRPENRFLSKNHRLGAAAGDFGDWQKEFAMILSSGVDGVFADHPDLAVVARAVHRAIQT
ncbi:MAG: glycerophosphodiester phosphodiesterase family protein [Microbacteriaceae bacterium]